MTEIHSTPAFPTLGEAFVGRHLKKEVRAGVDHYVPGQHLAELQGPPEDFAVAQLSWCTPLGLAVTVAVKQMPDGGWEPATDLFRLVGLGYDYGMRKLPADFEFTPDMETALTEVDREIEKS